MTFGVKEKRPLMGAMSGWTLGRARSDTNNFTNQDTPAIYHNASGNSAYTGVTDLLPCDVWSGVYNRHFYSIRDVPTEPRRLGRFPVARMGRSNVGDFSVIADPNNEWVHMRYGVWMPWSGSILP